MYTHIARPDCQKKKNPVNKNQGWKPIHQKHKSIEHTNTHNTKKKQKQTINKNQVKTPWLLNDNQ
jgi:hypothetical protein